MRPAVTRRHFLQGMGSLGAIGAVALLAACGGSGATTASATSSVASAAATTSAAATSASLASSVATKVNAANITLRYMDRAGALGDYMRHFSRVYEQQNPGVTVSNEDASWGDLVTKVETYAAAGTMADVAYQHTALMMPELAAKGVWLDLESMANADKWDFSIFYPWAIATCRQGPNDHLVATPQGVHTGQNNHLMYNVELLQKAGVQPPTMNMSVDDLTTLAVELKKALPGVWPIMEGMSEWDMEGQSRSWKGYIISPDRTKSGFSLPETQAAHQYFYDWVNKYQVMPGQQAAQPGQSVLFYNQKLAIAINCSANIWVGFNDAVKGKFTLGNAIWPQQPSGVIGTVPSVDATVVYGQSKHPDQAWGLAALMAGFDASKWTAINPPNMTPGAVIKAWHDPDVWKVNPPYKVDALWWDTLKEVGNMPVPANTRENEFSDAYGNGWAAMLYGSTPYTKENVDALQTKLQGIMNESLP